MKGVWEQDATSIDQYHHVECRRGREFIIRLTTGADVYRAIQKFAIDQGVKFGKIHAAFMGGFSPARMEVWVPDTENAENWHMERVAEFHNLSMVLGMSGMIHTRLEEGRPTPFPAIHYVIGGAWNVPTVGGHLAPGTLVKGVIECFVSEILGIEELLPSGYDPKTDSAPEEWYKEA